MPASFSTSHCILVNSRRTSGAIPRSRDRRCGRVLIVMRPSWWRSVSSVLRTVASELRHSVMGRNHVDVIGRIASSRWRILHMWSVVSSSVVPIIERSIGVVRRYGIRRWVVAVRLRATWGSVAPGSGSMRVRTVRYRGHTERAMHRMGMRCLRVSKDVLVGMMNRRLGDSFTSVCVSAHDFKTFLFRTIRSPASRGSHYPLLPQTSRASRWIVPGLWRPHCAFRRFFYYSRRHDWMATCQRWYYELQRFEIHTHERSTSSRNVCFFRFQQRQNCPAKLVFWQWR